MSKLQLLTLPRIVLAATVTAGLWSPARAQPAPAPAQVPAADAAPPEGTPAPAVEPKAEPAPAAAKPARRPRRNGRPLQPTEEDYQAMSDEYDAAMAKGTIPAWAVPKKPAPAVQTVKPQAEPQDESQETSALDRAGFTVEVSLGLAALRMAPSDGDGASFYGRSGANVTVGAFLLPRIALGLRFVATSHQIETEARDEREVTAFVGPVIQYWVNDRAFVGGGIGLNSLFDDNPMTDTSYGVGFDLRAGYNVHLTRNHAFHVAAEVTPAMHDEVVVGAIGFQLGWQML